MLVSKKIMICLFLAIFACAFSASAQSKGKVKNKGNYYFIDVEVKLLQEMPIEARHKIASTQSSAKARNLLSEYLKVPKDSVLKLSGMEVVGNAKFTDTVGRFKYKVPKANCIVEKLPPPPPPVPQTAPEPVPQTAPAPMQVQPPEPVPQSVPAPTQPQPTPQPSEQKGQTQGMFYQQYHYRLRSYGRVTYCEVRVNLPANKSAEELFHAKERELTSRFELKAKRIQQAALRRTELLRK